MVKKVSLSIDQILETCTSRSKLRGYQRQCVEETVEALQNDKDAAVELPTGTGKSFVYLPLSIAVADQNHRVCILCATNLMISQLKDKNLPHFRRKTQLEAVMGIEHYDCPLTGEKADYVNCTVTQKQECSEKGCQCDVLKYGQHLEKHNFIVTNFHKFLSTPIKNKFDLIVIDDSHGFESAIDDKFQSQIAYSRIDDLYNRHAPFKDKVSDLAGNFLDIFDDIIGSIPSDELKRKVADDDIKKMGEIGECDEVKDSLKGLDLLDRGTCHELLYFIRNCRDLTLNTFYVQKDFYAPDDPRETTLIARKSERYIENVLRSIFSGSRVIFVSAFLGNIAMHANYCTRRPKHADDTILVPKDKPPIVRRWFNRLRIYEVTDLVEGTIDPFDEGVALIAEMLKVSKCKSLLLFKNYRDQRRAEGELQRRIKRQITFIDESYETEQVQELVGKADIIMASASARLWEGIDISNLKFEVIFSLPFIRPPVYMDQFKSFPFVRRKMLIRLQQGIGRLIRREKDAGVCVILNYSKEPKRWMKLDSHKSSSIFSPELRERIVPVSKNVVCKRIDQVFRELKKERLVKGS